MMTRSKNEDRRWFSTAILLLLTTIAPTASAKEWRQHADPSRGGWSNEGLERAKEIATEAGSAAVMIVEDGLVVEAWGVVDRPLPIYSMRKGLYNALAGMLVEEGKIALDATLDDLGIEEIDPLTEVERSATVEDLLTSRSGIYHVSAYEPASMKRSRPERGSRSPGEHWFYNNWDFNLVAHLIEGASGRSLAELFRDRVASPLGMEDFRTDETFRFLEPSRSRFPAVIFRMSARDLARFGQLYLQGGRWEGQRLLDEDWIDASWTLHTVFPPGSARGAGNGFGYLWWIHPGHPGGERPFARRDVYLTRGSDGQLLAVVPKLDLVFVHQTAGEGGFEDAVRVFDAILTAREGGTPGRNEPKTVALDPEALGEPPPAPDRRSAVPWSAEMREALTGKYSLSPEIAFLLHEIDGRLFARPRGAPLAEVELFVDETGTIFSPAVDVELTPVRNEEGEIVALRGRIEGRPVRLERASLQLAR